MSASLQQTIQEQVRVLSEDEMREVLNYMQNLRKERKVRTTKPISAIFEDLSNEIPLEEWKELPTDGAENHDYYLYNVPKKMSNSTYAVSDFQPHSSGFPRSSN